MPVESDEDEWDEILRTAQEALDGVKTVPESVPYIVGTVKPQKKKKK